MYSQFKDSLQCRSTSTSCWDFQEREKPAQNASKNTLPILHTSSRLFLSASAEWASQDQENTSICLDFLKANQTSCSPHRILRESNNSWLRVECQLTRRAICGLLQIWQEVSLNSCKSGKCSICPSNQLCLRSHPIPFSMAILSSWVQWTSTNATACRLGMDTLTIHPQSFSHGNRGFHT